MAGPKGLERCMCRPIQDGSRTITGKRKGRQRTMTSGFVVFGSRTMSIYAILGVVLSLMPLRLLRPLSGTVMLLRLLPLSDAGGLLSIFRIAPRSTRDSRVVVVQGGMVWRAVASDFDFVCNGDVDCRI